MTTTPEVAPETTAAAEADDPFRYGWRYIRHERPNGYYDVEEVPLTLEDLLHPEEGDHVTHSDAHQRRCVYLYNVLRARVQDDPTAVVLHDVRIKWDTPELKAHGPDIMVIFGVQEHKNWSTFDVAAEGVRPALIIEVTSPETQNIDYLTKLEHYDLAEVPLYIIVDSGRRRGQAFLRLLGYRRTAVTYEVLPPDERGWLWLEPLRLWLGVRDGELYCYDEHGAQIADYTAVVAELTAAQQAQAAAEAKAENEQQARTTAEAQIEREQQARAAAEAQTATERQARIDAEARLQALEAELRRLRRDSE